MDDALAFLLEHLPPHLHLVITTREDPQLPLARLRARGQMNDLRAGDLRFTPDEAAAFLAQATGLALGADEVAALEQRTEGWIAGLQLAAISMRGRTDVHGFVQAFAGDNRYIVDYLVEEVLAQQPDAVRAFLLQTAILDRLCDALCTAVTGQAARAATCWRPWSAPISLSCRWTTSAAGIAITTSSPTCCAPISRPSSPIAWRCCTGAPAPGMPSTARGRCDSPRAGCRRRCAGRRAYRAGVAGDGSHLPDNRVAGVGRRPARRRARRTAGAGRGLCLGAAQPRCDRGGRSAAACGRTLAGGRRGGR